MVNKILDTIVISKPSEIEALISLALLTLDDVKYKDLVQTQLSPYPDFQARKTLLDSGFFSGRDLLSLLLGCGCSGGTRLTFVKPLLDRLIDWSLVSDSCLLGSNVLAQYQWNKARIRSCAILNIFDNILLGPSYIAQKYRASVPAILVEKKGDQFAGTGFIVANNPPNNDLFVVTAKHCVDPREEIKFGSFKCSAGISLTSLQSSWTLHPTLDLAAMRVKCDEGSPSVIYPVGVARVLSKTVTLGYPGIAFTDDAYLLAHSGEINATVNFYNDSQEYLLISNAVAPGNSGGPVLDEAGLCVGMVVRELEYKHVEGDSKANVALPANVILDFVSSI